MRRMTRIKTSIGNLNPLVRNGNGGFASILAIAALIFLAAFAFAVRAYNPRTPGSEMIERLPATALIQPSPAPLKAQSGAVPARVEVQVITVRPRGFEPSDITRPTGVFLLAVDNRSGLDELHLSLDREGGNRVHEQRVSRKKLDWRGAFDLPPGRYALTEAKNPDWVCTITITPH